MLAVSIAFTMVLLAFRIVYSGNISYIFYVWNLFLAIVPIMLSRRLLADKPVTKKVYVLLFVWILFLPNAPYVVTDLFHYRERWPVPKWYDLLLVTSASWNGLMAGFISVMQVEAFFSRHITKKKLRFVIATIFLLCGYGIYIGRYLRFNSWDMLADPMSLLTESAQHFLAPIEHHTVWKFTLLFAMMLGIIYHSLKQFSFNETRPLKDH